MRFFLIFSGLVLIITGCGGGGAGAVQQTIPVNSAPELPGITDYAVDENVLSVANFEATDRDGDTVTYSISGDDASYLSIDASTGDLAFLTAPDFENPSDSNRDNTYNLSVIASDGQASSSLDITVSINDLAGQHMVLIGNSFFKPYAERIGIYADNSGFTDHSDIGVFAGGDNGNPISLWNDTGEKNLQIKQALDEGGVDVFGMTAQDITRNPNPIDGYREWIAYALENNPDVDILISVPPIDFPTNWEARAQEVGAEDIHELHAYFVNEMINKTLIDQLRIEFPSTSIFSIPTGRAAKELWQMHNDDLLLDELAMSGPYNESLFTDLKGHQGRVIVVAGTLMWLNGLYDVDLATDDFDTGFQTDLHALAQQIMVEHDPNYRR